MPEIERALLVVLPDAASHKDSITALVDSLGFFIMRQGEVTLSVQRAQQYLHGSKYTQRQLEHLTSGPLHCLQLSKVDAVRALGLIVGAAYDEPSDARDMAPQSLRALYGTDQTRCAVKCSPSLEAANREIAVIFPSKPLRSLPAQEYLMETVLPGMSEGVAEVAAEGSTDPFKALERWLLQHNPTSQVAHPDPILLHQTVVLKQEALIKAQVPSVMGSDVVKVNRSKDVLVDSAEDFRECKMPESHTAETEYPVFSVGPAGLGALDDIFEYLTQERGFISVLVVNVRSDPAVFIGNESYGVSKKTAIGTYRPAAEFSQVDDGPLLCSLEHRLVNDIQVLATINQGRLPTAGDPIAVSAAIGSEPRLRTMAEGYRHLQTFHRGLQYKRLPLTDPAAEGSVVDELLDTIQQHLLSSPQGRRSSIGSSPKYDVIPGRCIVFQYGNDDEVGSFATSMACTVLDCLLVAPADEDSKARDQDMKPFFSYRPAQQLLGHFDAEGQLGLKVRVERSLQPISSTSGHDLGLATWHTLREAQQLGLQGDLVGAGELVSAARVSLQHCCLLVVISAFLLQWRAAAVTDHVHPSAANLVESFSSWKRRYAMMIDDALRVDHL